MPNSRRYACARTRLTRVAAWGLPPPRPIVAHHGRQPLQGDSHVNLGLSNPSGGAGRPVILPTQTVETLAGGFEPGFEMRGHCGVLG